MNTQKNPYIGPRTFQRSEGHLFFGREREARDLISLVASERLVVFYAQSGAGKSSIVNTRLIPNLEEKEYEVLPVGRVSGDSGEGLDVHNIYVYNLLRSLEQHDVDPSHLAKLTLAQFLCQLNYDDKGFFFDASMPDSIPTGEDESVIRRALIVDQFEELFSTHPEAWEKREDFFQQVAQAMQDDPHLWIVLVMREDFIAALDPYAHLVSNGLRVRYYMQRLGREAGLKAVKSPVEGIRPYAGGVAEKLIDDLCSIKVQQPDGTLDVQPGQYVEPVQMQVVCYGLWDNLSPDGTQITEQDLQDVGDVNQSLGKYYDKRVGEVARTRNVRERMIREWFENKLITAGGIRNMVLQERDPKPGELSDDVIQALQSDLVRGEKRGGATWYELTHDRLVEPILERNKIWFSENLSPLQRQAALWKDQDQHESWLLTGDALDEVASWAKEHQDELTDTENEFLASCRKAQKLIDEQHAAERQRLEMAQKIAEEQARSARRARIFNVISAVLIIIASIATVASVRNANRAEQLRITAEEEKANAVTQSAIAHSGELSIAALERANSQLDLAILLGVKAHSFYPTSQSEKALLTLLQKSGRFAGTLPTQENVQSMQYSPDGKTFASLNENGITFWDAESREALNTQPINGHYRSVTTLAMNEAGNLLASGAMDGTILLWNSQTHEKLTEEPFKAGNERIVSLAFSPDAKILAAAGEGAPRIILWDITDPKNPQQSEISFSRDTGNPTKLAFSPDGKTIASGSDTGYVILWNVETYQPVSDPAKNKKKQGSVSGLEFNTAGNFLISTSYDSSIFLWDAKNVDQPIVEFPHETSWGYYSMAISADDKTMATALGDGSMLLWDISQPDDPSTIGEAFNQNSGIYISDLAFNGSILASASHIGKVELWDVRDPAKPHKISTARSGNPLPLNRVLLSEDGKTLISASSDSMISFWDLSDPQQPRRTARLEETHPGRPFNQPYEPGMQFSPDGSLLKSVGEDGALLIDSIANKLLGRGDFLTSPDGDILAYQVSDKTTGKSTIYLKNIETGEEIGGPLSGQDPLFSPDSNKLVYQTYDLSGMIQFHIWDITAREELKPTGAGDYVAFPDGFLLKFSPDSAVLVYQAASLDGSKPSFNLWDIANEKNAVQDIDGTYLNISPDGKVLVYQTNDDEVQGILRNIETADEKVITGSNFFPSQNGNVLAYITTDTGINLLDIATGAPLLEPIEDGTIIWALSRTGKVLLYTGSDENGRSVLIALDTDSGNTIFSDPLNGWFNSFMEAGQTFAYTFNSESTDHTRFINTTNTQKTSEPLKGFLSGLSQNGEILTFQTYENNLWKLNWWNTIKNNSVLSPIVTTDQRLVKNDQLLMYQTTESNGNTVSLFDLETNKPIGEPVTGAYMALSPDGNTLVTKNETDAIIFWDMAQTASLGEQIGPKESSISSAALGADGKTLAFADVNGIKLQHTDGSDKGILPNEHIGKVNSVALSPDKKLLLTLGEDNQIIVWDTATYQPVGDPIPGINAYFSPDGKSLAISNYIDSKSTITIWDLTSWKAIGDPIPGASGTFSPDGKTLFITDLIASTPTVTMLDLASQQMGNPMQGYIQISATTKDAIALVDTSNQTTTFWKSETPINGTDSVFAGTKPDILVVRDASKTTLWNSVTHEQIGAALDGVYYPSFCANGERAAWFDADTLSILVWDLEEDLSLGAVKMDKKSKDSGGVGITFSPDCSILAIGQYWDNKTRFWDISKEDYISNPIDGTGAVFSPDGSTVLTLDGTGSAVFWNVSTAKQMGDKVKGNWGFEFDPDKGNIVAIRNMDWATSTWSVTIWNLNKGIKIGDDMSGFGDHYVYLPGGTGLIRNVPVLTADGRLVIYDDRGVRFWDVEKNQQVGETLQGHSALVTSMLFSPAGHSLASLASDGIVLTDLDKGSSVHLEKGDYSGQLTGTMAFNPEGTRLTALGSNNAILTWHLTGDPVLRPTLPKSPSTGYVYRSTLSPDGKYLVYESSLLLKVWDIEREEAVKETDLELCCGGYIVFSSDGKSLFYNEGATVFRWDGWNDPSSNSTPGKVFSLGQTYLSNMSLMMGVDAPRYLVVSYDQSGKQFTQIWELDKNTRVGDPITGNVQVLGSSPHSQVMIYKDIDGRLFQWDLNPENWIRTLCAKAGRNFTREEWDQYIGLEEFAHQDVCP